MPTYYNSDAVGVAVDGGFAIHELNLVPLPQRNAVRKLEADENADRAALYREVATANGQPQWEGQIRDIVAKRWAARAQPGWWVQSDTASWTKK